MLYFIHILADLERIVDHEGHDLADLGAARLEATQAAREIMAGELVAGNQVPLGWKAQIEDGHGNVVLTLPFAPLVLGENEVRPRPNPVGSVELHERVKRIMTQFRTHHSEIVENVKQLRQQLHALERFSRTDPTKNR